MIREVKKLAKSLGYVIYSEPYKLNIWGFRANSTKPNSFDDEFHVFTNIGTEKRKRWAYWVFKCTTDPGTYWLKNWMNPQGTAILNAGQYINSHSIGMHRGKYLALVQRGSLTVTRDYNRDNVLDFHSGKVTKGIFGVNIHRSSLHGDTLRVDKYSAGCQVFKNGNDFAFFMKLCERHRKYNGNKFTYTLIDKRAEYRSKFKFIAITSTLIGLFIGGYFLIKNDTNEQRN